MDPQQIVKLCRQNCLQKELPLNLEDYQAFHAKTKGNTPLKQFAGLSDQEKLDYYKFIFYENRLNEVSNSELQFLMFCTLLEYGANKTKTFIQDEMDMQPQQQFTCRNIQQLKLLEQNKTFIDSMRKFPKQFKPFCKLQRSESEDSFGSDTTCDDEETIPKRLETNERVLKVQTLLQKQGYKVEVNGLLNADTENTIRQYQQKNNLYVDGLITSQLINKLEGKPNKEQKQPVVKPGGIDLNTKLKEVTQIRGLKFDNKNQLKFLVDKKDKLEFSGVDSDDLALCLKVYYDQTVHNKVISFSLDPWEENRPDGEFQKKILYPDVLEKRKILSGSRFSELMFECDYYLKQMSLGLLPDCKTPFPYPQEIVKLGLKPLSAIIEEKEQRQEVSKQNWSRLWLVCKKVEGFVDQNKKGVFLSNDVKIEVDARQMEQDQSGKLIDKVIQDKSDPCFIFAKKFSELYPVIAKYYPCFEQLKKLYRATALARWIFTNRIQIDMAKINATCERQFSCIKNYNDKVNSIRQSKEIQVGVIEKKIPVDVKVVAERSLKKSGQEVNEKNIKLAVEYLIKQNNGSSEFFDIQKGKKVQSKFVLGGVDMNCEISPLNNKRQPKDDTPTSGQKVSISKVQNSSVKSGDAQQKQVSQEKVKAELEKVKAVGRKIDEIASKYDDDIDSLSTIGSITSLDDNYITQNVREEEFSFELQSNCDKCKKKLNQQEQMHPVESKYYCFLHHPFSCFYCGKLIQGQAATVNGRQEFFDSEAYNNKKVHMHLDCNLIFQNKCVDKLNIERQNQEVLKVNLKVLEQIQKNLPKIKKLDEMTLKKSKTYTCDLCKKNNKNSTSVVCSLCGLVNQEQANSYLKECFPSK